MGIKTQVVNENNLVVETKTLLFPNDIIFHLSIDDQNIYNTTENNKILNHNFLILVKKVVNTILDIITNNLILNQVTVIHTVLYRYYENCLCQINNEINNNNHTINNHRIFLAKNLIKVKIKVNDNLYNNV